MTVVLIASKRTGEPLLGNLQTSTAFREVLAWCEVEQRQLPFAMIYLLRAWQAKRFFRELKLFFLAQFSEALT